MNPDISEVVDLIRCGRMARGHRSRQAAFECLSREAVQVHVRRGIPRHLLAPVPRWLAAEADEIW